MTEKTAAIIAFYTRNGYTVKIEPFVAAQRLHYRAIFSISNELQGYPDPTTLCGVGQSIDEAVAMVRTKAEVFIELWRDAKD